MVWHASTAQHPFYRLTLRMLYSSSDYSSVRIQLLSSTTVNNDFSGECKPCNRRNHLLPNIPVVVLAVCFRFRAGIRLPSEIFAVRWSDERAQNKYSAEATNQWASHLPLRARTLDGAACIMPIHELHTSYYHNICVLRCHLYRVVPFAITNHHTLSCSARGV